MTTADEEINGWVVPLSAHFSIHYTTKQQRTENLTNEQFLYPLISPSAVVTPDEQTQFPTSLHEN